MSRRFESPSPFQPVLVSYLDSSKALRARLGLLGALLEGFGDPDGLGVAQIQELGTELRRVIDELIRAEAHLRPRTKRRRR